MRSARICLDHKQIVRLVPLALLLAGCSSAPPPPLAEAPPPPVQSSAPLAEAPPPPVQSSAPIVEAPPPVQSSAAPATPPPSDRLAGAYTLDQLRLIALIVGTPTPRAMLVDPAGLGVVVKVGDLVARDEELRPGDAASSAPWRVKRIGNKELVLVRRDPARPAAPSETRVLPLAPPKQP